MNNTMKIDENNFINPDNFSISKFGDGGLILSCGIDGMNTDLIFACGAMDEEDPLFERQKMILEFIINKIKNV